MARLCSRLLAAAVASILLASALPAQAQHVTFTDIRDAVSQKYFSASADTTMPDAANPNALVIGFENGFAAKAPDGDAVASDTLSFNVVAPSGYYVSSITYSHEGTGSVIRVAGARGTSALVANGEPAVVGVFGRTPTAAGTVQLTGQPTTVPVSITTTLVAFAPEVGGGATISLAGAKVTATIALESGPVKKTAKIDVAGFSGPYDGAEHRATGTAIGADGEDLSGLLDLGLGFTNVPGGTAQWTFAGNDDYHAGSGSVAIDIAPVDATINVAGFSGTYDGNPHGATGTAVGVGNEILNSSLDLGATFTNVPGGTAHWTFSGNTNYNAAEGDAAVTIGKATPVITWAAPASVVAGTALGATQLNATANVPGTFVYSPAAGTVLTASQQLSVAFTPSDAVNYNGAAATVPITVTPNAGVQIVNPGSQIGRVGQDVELRLRVTGTPLPGVRGFFGAAGLPPGLELDGNEIEGEPTRAGIYVVTIWFTQGGSTTSTRFVWTVLPRRFGGN